VLYLLAFAVLAWWFLDYTPAGKYLYSIASGNNQSLSDYFTINEIAQSAGAGVFRQR